MYYWVYGFALKSDFELPELREITREEAEAGPPPMVEIVNGPVPEALPGERRLANWLSYSGRSCLYSIPDVGRVQVEDGCRVTVDLDRGVPESDMRTVLLGSGLGTVSHQRGLLPLHISAVMGPSGAIAFTGPSGIGKSTTAMTLNRKIDSPIVADDVAIVDISQSCVKIEGGGFRSRLWRDALERLDIPIDNLLSDNRRLEKYQVISDRVFAKGAQPMRSLVVLEPASQKSMTVLNSAEKLTRLFDAIYRPFLLRLFQNESLVFSKITHICQRLEVSIVGRENKERERVLKEHVLQR